MPSETSTAVNKAPTYPPVLMPLPDAIRRQNFQIFVKIRHRGFYGFWNPFLFRSLLSYSKLITVPSYCLYLCSSVCIPQRTFTYIEAGDSGSPCASRPCGLLSLLLISCGLHEAPFHNLPGWILHYSSHILFILQR